MRNFFVEYFIKRVIQNSIEIYSDFIPFKYGVKDLSIRKQDFIAQVQKAYQTDLNNPSISNTINSIISNTIKSIISNTIFMHTIPSINDITVYEEKYVIYNLSKDELKLIFEMYKLKPNKNPVFYQLYPKWKNGKDTNQNSTKKSNITVHSDQSEQGQAMYFDDGRLDYSPTSFRRPKVDISLIDNENYDIAFIENHPRQGNCSGIISNELAQRKMKIPTMQLTLHEKLMFTYLFQTSTTEERIQIMKTAASKNDLKLFTFFESKMIDKYKKIAETCEYSISMPINHSYYEMLSDFYQQKFDIQIRQFVHRNKSTFEIHNTEIKCILIELYNHFNKEKKSEWMTPYYALSLASDFAKIIKVQLDEIFRRLKLDVFKQAASLPSNTENLQMLEGGRQKIIQKLIINLSNIDCDDLYEDQILLIDYIIEKIEMIVKSNNSKSESKDQLVRNYFFAVYLKSEKYEAVLRLYIIFSYMLKKNDYKQLLYKSYPRFKDRLSILGDTLKQFIQDESNRSFKDGINNLLDNLFS